MTEIKKTSLEATLGGEKITIDKLKSGKYYKAQEIYLGMIDSVRVKKSDTTKVGEDEDAININNLYSTFPLEVIKLVAFCTNLEEKILLENSYPEEITDMVSKVIELNNFNANLKNSVAPLENLGAKKL